MHVCPKPASGSHEFFIQPHPPTHTVLRFWNMNFPLPNKGALQGVILQYLYGPLALTAWDTNLELYFAQKLWK
jgi:hypothetical protein